MSDLDYNKLELAALREPDQGRVLFGAIIEGAFVPFTEERIGHVDALIEQAKAAKSSKSSKSATGGGS